ncbi:hypothetical protein CXG81DRAFT_9548, partial [Caulochytrium protostelioides]
GNASQQVQLARRKIATTKNTTGDMVTNVVVGSITREQQRRAEQEAKTEQWEAMLAADKEADDAAQAVIDAQWEKLLALKGPHALHEQLQVQKGLCDNVISKKKELIDQYTEELKTKDDIYISELKRESEELEKLLARIDEQHKQVRQVIAEEHRSNERAFVQERQEFLSDLKKQMEQLYQDRATLESRIQTERAQRIAGQIQEMQQLRLEDGEDYHMVKIKLETDIQVLEQQLQQMKAMYQLNTEKLEYNYQVLKKREEENGVILSTQKRKITRLTDTLNHLRAKTAKQERQQKQEAQSLSENYVRITSHFAEVRRKNQHFRVADHRRFQDVLDLKREEALAKVRTLMKADRLIFENQLGRRSLLAPAATDLLLQTQAPQVEETNEMQNAISSQMAEWQRDDTPVKRALDLLAREADFLLEDKLQRLIKPLKPHEQTLMKLDTIFKALGIQSLEDVGRLVSRFFKPASKPHKSLSVQASALGLAPEALQTSLIAPQEVMAAIKAFMAEMRSEGRPVAPAADFASPTRRPISGPASGSPVAHGAEGHGERGTAENASNPNTRAFWTNLADIIQPERIRTWETVYGAMQKYHQLLVQRQAVAEEHARIAQQNEELRNLLARYRGAAVNDELIIPPHVFMQGLGANEG